VRVFGFPQKLADPIGSFEVGEHQNVEQLGAGSGAECVEALTEFALDLLEVHGIGRLALSFELGLQLRFEQCIRSILAYTPGPRSSIPVPDCPVGRAPSYFVSRRHTRVVSRT
jgi:hypothetical protein